MRNDLCTKTPFFVGALLGARRSRLQRRSNSWILQVKCLLQVFGEVLRFHVANDFVAVALLAIRAKEYDSWRPKDPKTLQQCLIGLIVRRNVCLQCNCVRQRLLYTGVGEGVLLHLDAGHAPVCVEIEHCGFSIGRSRGNLAVKIIDGFKVDAVDTTAAGDTFNGALAVGLAEGQAIEDAIQFANAAAALSVTKLGAQPSAHSRDEIDSFLKK